MGLASAAGDRHNARVRRLVTDSRGRPHRTRTFLVFAVFVVLAVFGPTALIWIPRWTESSMWRGILVGLFVVMLKVPLILLLFSYIRQNAEWPGQPVKWEAQEVSEILQAIRAGAARADEHPDREARLAHLSREAWNVADRLEGQLQVDALTVALQIDQRLIALRERSSSPGRPGDGASS